MQCYARWEEDKNSNVFFRDQTILQFGDNWNFLASFVLLNPGSALPKSNTDQTALLRSQELPFFVEPSQGESYVEFSIDRLMHDVLKMFSQSFSGGTIRLHNLFNLKNQKSAVALGQIHDNQQHPKMFSKDTDIKFCDAPVVIASGGGSKTSPRLKQELIRYISHIEKANLYRVGKSGNHVYDIITATPDADGFIESYHPSYTFKYGNVTRLGQLRSR